MILITKNNIIVNVDTITTMGIAVGEDNTILINTQRLSFETYDEMIDVFNQIETYMINSSGGLLVDLRSEDENKRWNHRTNRKANTKEIRVGIFKTYWAS